MGVHDGTARDIAADLLLDLKRQGDEQAPREQREAVANLAATLALAESMDAIEQQLGGIAATLDALRYEGIPSR